MLSHVGLVLLSGQQCNDLSASKESVLPISEPSLEPFSEGRRKCSLCEQTFSIIDPEKMMIDFKIHVALHHLPDSKINTEAGAA
jgi:hypothetical protein